MAKVGKRSEECDGADARVKRQMGDTMERIDVVGEQATK